MYRFDPRAALAWTADNHAPFPRFEVLDETDGFLSTAPSGGGQPAACVTEEGRIWFATSHGLVQLDPHLLAPSGEPAPVQIETLMVEGLVADRARPWLRQDASSIVAGSPSPTGPLRLQPGSGRQIEFHDPAIDLKAPERVRFAYRLVGNDDQWIQAGNRRTASYTNLKPGRYRFEVSAFDRHALANSPRSTATLAFEIEPFLHQRPWFRAPLAAALTLALSGLAAWGWRSIRRRHHLERRVAIAEERMRIADDLHDRIGANLSRMAREFQRPNPDRLEARPPALQTDLQATMTDLDQIVWLLQPDRDTLPHLAEQLIRLADRWFADAELERRWQVSLDLPPLPLAASVRRDLLLLANEALHNIARHAGARTVELSLRLTDDDLTLHIADDGRGFDPAVPHRAGQGLPSMRRRAERLAARLQLHSCPGQGTRLILVIPRNRLDPPPA